MNQVSTLAKPSRTPARIEPPPPGASIRWLISRAAIHRARPDLIASASGPQVALHWEVDRAPGAGVRGGASLVDGDRAIPLLCLTGLDAARADTDRAAHIDIRGLLSATLRFNGRTSRLVYARTMLLERWGIAGGRYEVAPSPTSDCT